MASRSGAVVADPPTTQPGPFPHSSVISNENTERVSKRQREPESTSPRSTSSQRFQQPVSPVKSARLGFDSTLPPPPPLTGAAALLDERRRLEEEHAQGHAPVSDSPSQRALAALMSGGDPAMSRLGDAPQSAPTATMDSIINKAATAQPRLDDAAAQDVSTLANSIPVTESPAPMEVDNKGDHLASQQVAGQEERAQAVSLSYPGSLQSNTSIDTPARGMSFPMSGQGQNSPTASGTKKHKCPYCNTEFTRQHNLKSHLLTHSQEKPYVCTECQMRFRRLHDLKRHGKLHTGEKPHICPKCERKFARGDALARHGKGAGGCAGRRSSMGSFADGDEMDPGMGDADDSAMSGLAYDNVDEEDIRRRSLPGINAPHVPSGQGDSYAPHARTYPPAAAARSVGSGLYPPNVAGSQTSSSTSPSVPNSMASNHTPATSISSTAISGGAVGVTGMYSQTGMTESPKPLSPGVHGPDTSSVARQRSPSLSQQLQQQQFERRQSELQSSHGGRGGPKLPGLSHPRFPSPSPSGYTHGRAQSGNQAGVDSSNMFAQSDPNLWAYIQTLEEKVKSLSDKVTSLDHTVTDLKSKLEARDGAVATS